MACVPAPSSTKNSFTGTPPMPPFLFHSSTISSADALPGTPNTDAGPDVKVVMPILSSFGLSAARPTDAIPTHALAAINSDFIMGVLLRPLPYVSSAHDCRSNEEAELPWLQFLQLQSQLTTLRPRAFPDTNPDRRPGFAASDVAILACAYS